jgi:hypothetical protein
MELASWQCNFGDVDLMIWQISEMDVYLVI